MSGAPSHSYYDPGDRRAERVQDLFGRVARRYDLINDVQSLGLHRLWKRRLVAMARLSRGQRALDLCCGTGDVTAALSRTGAEAVGLDFSAAMLAVARERWRQGAGATSSPRPGPISFVEGDALYLPFPAATFDAVTVSYGLRNLANPRAGLEEMWRVTKPGGRLLVLDFGKPPNRVWRRVYFVYLRWMVPCFGRWFCGNSAAYAYILESLENYPAQAGIAQMLRDLGAEEVQVIDLLGGAMSIHCAQRPPDPTATVGRVSCISSPGRSSM